MSVVGTTFRRLRRASWGIVGEIGNVLNVSNWEVDCTGGEVTRNDAEVDARALIAVRTNAWAGPVTVGLWWPSRVLRVPTVSDHGMMILGLVPSSPRLQHLGSKERLLSFRTPSWLFRGWVPWYGLPHRSPEKLQNAENNNIETLIYMCTMCRIA